MGIRTRQAKSKGIGKGLWIDQAVLIKHLQSRSTRSFNSDDKNAEVNNHILKLADLVLAEERRFDQE